MSGIPYNTPTPMPPRPFRSRMGARRQARRSAPRSQGLRTLAGPLRANNRMAAGTFPDRVRTVLRYTTNVRVSPGIVTGSGYVLAINDLFDPDRTAAGHQPRGFDNWAAIYQKYRVHSCLMDVTVRQRAAHGISCWVIPRNFLAALAVADIPAELPRSVWLGVTGSNQPPAHMRNLRIQCNQVLGQTSAQYLANENTAAAVTASPAESVFAHVWVEQLDATTVADFELQITLTYDAEFFDRALIGPSAALDHFRAALLHTEEPEEDEIEHVSRPPSPAPSRLASGTTLRRALSSAPRR